MIITFNSKFMVSTTITTWNDVRFSLLSLI